MADMDVDTPGPPKRREKQRFEVKKYGSSRTMGPATDSLSVDAVSLWAWGMISIPESDSIP